MEQTASERMSEKYEELCTLASSEVERMAREVLRKRPDIHEFVNAMGATFFVDEEGNNEYPFEIEEADELNEFLMEWDHKFHISGDPMRFTAEGPKVTDW